MELKCNKIVFYKCKKYYVEMIAMTLFIQRTAKVKLIHNVVFYGRLDN